MTKNHPSLQAERPTSVASSKPDQSQSEPAHSSVYRDLPAPDTQRWDTKRKAQVVAAVRNGQITIEQACDIYAMSMDELLTWQSLFDRYGAKGLMATRVKEFRSQRLFS